MIKMLSMLFASALMLMMALSSVTVQARSNTQLMVVGGCDLSPRFDTNTKTPMLTGAWPNGRFGRNKTGAGNAGTTIGVDSGIMRWTDAPVPAAFYTIRSGDSATIADPTTYMPGVMSEIHIRVTDIRRRFIGIVMYATNTTNPPPNTAGSEKRVGSWQFPTEPNAGANFQLPDICGGNVVGHTDADLKPIHTRFFFTAPKGTGKIKFRVLLKQGEQNRGSFFYPVKELMLNEAALPTVNATSQSVIGKLGIACADVCRQQTPETPYCSKTALTAVNSVESLQSAVVGKATCRLPMLSGCEYAGVPTFGADGYCTFRAPAGNTATTCPAAFVNVTLPPSVTGADVCYTAPVASAKAICVCTNDIQLKGANPFTGQNDELGSAGSISVNGALIAILAAIASMVSTTGAKSSRSAMISFICVALVLALASPVTAHNYIKSQHRANVAAVSNPCQERLGTQPHVQVVANQPFEVEWSVGHGDYAGNPFYFVTVPASAYLKLKLDNITAIVKDYVAKAPAAAYKSSRSDAEMWEKHHLRLPTELERKDANGVLQFPNYAQYFKEPNGIANSSSLFYVREAAYMDKAHPSQYKKNSKGVMPTIIQTRFNTDYIKDDKRVSYASTVYPWIESVEIFTNAFFEHYVYNDQSDFARFAIPARHGPGDYIVWFYWAGYKDCIDVNVMPGTKLVDLKYGYNTTGQLSTVIKQDHCEYTYIPDAHTAARRVSNVTRDISLCIADARKAGSTGVQVVRATNPAGTLPFPVNIPYVPFLYNQEATSLCGGTGAYSVASRVFNNCTTPTNYNLLPARFGNTKLLDNDYICFGVIPLRNQDAQVEEDYTIASDPQDPVFYSTCYQFVPVGGFLNVPEVVWTPPSWSVADQCLDCAFHANLNSLPVNRTVDWTQGLRPKTSAGCPNCNLVNSKLSASDLKATMVGANQPNSP